MERQIQNAFITTPVIKSQQISQRVQKQSQNLRQKIITILKSLDDKQMLFQAINNTGIPRNFSDINYISSRPQNELERIYKALLALKKQVQRIKRQSNKFVLIKNFSEVELSKQIEPILSKSKRSQGKNRSLEFLNKQIPVQTRIREAIRMELQRRQNLQKTNKKTQEAQKIRSEYLKKRKQAAKMINKKANQVYQKQKEVQEKQFQKIFETMLKVNQPQINQSSSIIQQFDQTSNFINKERNRHHRLVKERLQRSKLQFQRQLQQQMMQKLQKQTSIKIFKHQRLNSLNERAFINKTKSLEVINRKIHTAEEEQNRKINLFIQKQIKSLQNKKLSSAKNKNIKSQPTQMATFNGSSLFRINQAHSLDKNKQDEKENLILQRIARNNEIRQQLLNEKVQRIRQRHRKQEQKRQAFKESQIQFLAQHSYLNQSYVYQHDLTQTKNNKFNFTCTINPQQKNIKKKHESALKNITCEQTIMKLKKLPKSALIKKLKELRNEQSDDTTTENIVKVNK